MAVSPTATEIRGLLENYGITASIVSDTWIEARRDAQVVPYIEDKLGMKMSATEQKVEYHSGTGTDMLILNRRPIISLDLLQIVQGTYVQFQINTQAVEVLADEGILKAKYSREDTVLVAPLFPRGNNNIKVTFTCGFAAFPADLKEAVMCLTAVQILGLVADQTGGGSLTVQGYSRSGGSRGKYSFIRDDLYRQAVVIMRRYMTSVVT